MANTKISALTALTGADTDAAADLLPIVDTSATQTKKITPAQLFIGMGQSGTNTGDETAARIGVLINGAGAATPNDTDLVATAESSVLKKITWTNVKAFLKTYFDTLYQAAGTYLTPSSTNTVSNKSIDLGSNTVTGTKAQFDAACSDGNFAYQSDLSAKQDTLVSGTNIKTINGSSILGSGDLTVGGGGYDNTIWVDDEHFMRTSTVSGEGFSISNSGAGSGGSSQTSVSDHPGIWSVATGTTTTGFANLNHVRSTSWFEFADGAIFADFLVKTPAALSDGTDTYTVRIGYGQATNADGNNGAFFRYTHGTNSGNWQFIVRAGGSDVLVINTSVAFVADTWVRLRFTIAASTQAVECFVNETSAGTGTPSSTVAAGQLVGRVFQIVKSAGTTNRILYIDRHYTKQTLTF